MSSAMILFLALIAAAYLTLLERKALGAWQRRVGPTYWGWYGLAQPFADALKLVIKTGTTPGSATQLLFHVTPPVSLGLAFTHWALLPLAPGLVVVDNLTGVLWTLALASLGAVPQLLAGWSSSSAFGLIGSVRAGAQLISYEVVYSTLVLTLIVLSSTACWSTLTSPGLIAAWPLLPGLGVFVIVILAETGRAPFDLVEAESELVAGFFVEHAALPFVGFFLAEYLGILQQSFIATLLWSSIYLLGIQTALFVIVVYWSRATLPRLRWDQLMGFCWLYLLPLAIGLLLLTIAGRLSL